MGRIRTIKPEFWGDEKLSVLSEATHMLAAALLNYADDDGYFNANPKLVQAACFPLRELSVSIHGGLTELSNIGYLQLCVGVDGRSYGRIVNFRKHQKINRASPSRIKELCRFTEDSLNTHGGLTEDSRTEQGTGNREQGEESDPLPPSKFELPERYNTPEVRRWIPKWKSHWHEVHCKPLGDDRLLTQLMEPARNGWTPERLCRSFELAISKNAKSLIDPEKPAPWESPAKPATGLPFLN